MTLKNQQNKPNFASSSTIPPPLLINKKYDLYENMIKIDQGRETPQNKYFSYQYLMMSEIVIFIVCMFLKGLPKILPSASPPLCGRHS